MKVSMIGSHFVTFLGRVTNQKRTLVLCRGREKSHSGISGCSFIVAGPGDLLPQIIERGSPVKLELEFSFHRLLIRQPGMVPTDVYVMPSVSEPFGIAPLEAIRIS